MSRTESDMSAENLSHILQQNINNKDLKGMKNMRIKYFGKNKENGTERVAIIRFTDNEFDLYEYIAKYENTYGDPGRDFFKGLIIGIKRDENGVWINDAYIQVDDFTDFNDLKANYKEAKKEFKSLKKRATETELETATETKPETATETENTTEKTELNTNYDDLADEKFHQLTKTLIKSLFKAIGTDETSKIPFIISNNMVFFNYNDTQYKYYPSQCKVFKKCGRKYQRINWRDFADDNSSSVQKQALGRSPPLLLI